MQRYWLCLENGDLQGPYEETGLALLQQQGILQPEQKLQRVIGGDILPARDVLGSIFDATRPVDETTFQHALRLTPLNTAELIDRTFEFYRQHFLQLFLMGCMAYGLISFATMLGNFLPKVVQPGDMFQILLTKWPLLLTSMLLWLVGAVILILLQGALTILVAETYLGRPMSIRKALTCLPARTGPILLTVLLKCFLLSLAFCLILIPPIVTSYNVTQFENWHWWVLGLTLVLALVPGLILLVRWFITLPVLMIEGHWGWSAISRSSQLITHRRGAGFWQWGEMRLSIILLLLFVVSILLSLAGYLPEMINDLLTQQRMQNIANIGLLTSVLDFLTSSLLLPLYTVATTLFYLDLRMRREGLDLEMLAHQLGPDASPASS